MDEIGAALEISLRKSLNCLAQKIGILRTTENVATKLLKLKPELGKLLFKSN